MGALVRYEQEFLEGKEETQLRLVLAREFKHTKGISVLSKSELIQEILERHEVRKSIEVKVEVKAPPVVEDIELEDEVEFNKIDEESVYRDEDDTQFKILSLNIDENTVDVEDEHGNEDTITMDDFNERFEEMDYDEFAKPQPVVEKSKKREVSAKKGDISKSERVREVLRELKESGRKYTSGTVMLLLAEKFDIKIHRSFVITLMKKFDKAQAAKD